MHGMHHSIPASVNPRLKRVAWQVRCRAMPVSRDGAVLFFQLINVRYEHASTVLTSNKGFEEWGEIFGDEVMAAALIDRIVHHCHVVNIRGNSYRMREHADLWQSIQEETPKPRPGSPSELAARRRRPKVCSLCRARYKKHYSEFRITPSKPVKSGGAHG